MSCIAWRSGNPALPYVLAFDTAECSGCSRLGYANAVHADDIPDGATLVYAPPPALFAGHDGDAYCSRCLMAEKDMA